MSFLSIQALGRNRETPRLWIESQRLDALGFGQGVALAVETRAERLVLRAALIGENHVSSRSTAGGRRPIIDLENRSLLASLAEYSAVKIIASFERIEVTPSVRAFAIQRSRSLTPPLRVLEVFAGGGTLTAALEGNASFCVAAGVEIQPDYADEWQARHPEATLLQTDLRALHSTEVPEFAVLIGGIPCTSHSNLGRAKKSLAGQPELGDTGDLFLPVLTLISERMPVAVVLENVPAFGTSLAGQLVAATLTRLGYAVAVTTLQPNAEWGEIEDRRRWLLTATLDQPFVVQPPGVRCTTPVSAFLDPPAAERDRADADRIARTIEGLRAHHARHQAAGHGFGFSVIAGTETRIGTIPKSYHKINTGPFVQTPFGLRLLRQSEIERIHGCELRRQHYATAIQMLGQGVQTRVFREVFRQLGEHLFAEGRLGVCRGGSR